MNQQIVGRNPKRISPHKVNKFNQTNWMVEF